MNKQLNEQSDEIKLLRDEKYDLRQIIETEIQQLKRTKVPRLSN